MKSFWLMIAKPPVSSARTRRLSCDVRDVVLEVHHVDLLIEVRHADQAARVDRVDGRVGAVGFARQLAELGGEVGEAELVALFA